MRKLSALLDRAQHSRWALFQLNFLLKRGIPFNAPHGIKIIKIDDSAIVSHMDYRRANQNHIRGIHACGIATVSEFSAGLCLMMNFSSAEYRIIMSQLEIQYHYQAKMTIQSKASLSTAQRQSILQALQEEGVAKVKQLSECHDEQGNHVASCYTHWQIKPWSQVRTQR